MKTKVREVQKSTSVGISKKPLEKGKRKATTGGITHVFKLSHVFMKMNALEEQ
jgi:hypothetical protein